MKAVQGGRMPFFSVLGVPLLGVGALIICLWNPQVPFHPETAEGTTLMLQDPDPRLDRSLSLYLRAEAKEVARCRRARHAGLAEAVSNYNLVARECTPAVFPATGLPPFQEP